MRPSARRHEPQSIGAIVAVAMHALAGAALLSYEPSRQAALAAVPVMVELITPPRAEPKPVAPAPLPPPRKPRSVAKAAVQPPPLPVVAAPAEAPAPEVVPPPPPPAPAPVVAPAPPPAVEPVTPPVFAADYLDNPPPVYPAVSRRRGEQGRVVLRVLVSAGGKADEVEIRTSSGHARLDEAALETVRGWRFVPARRGAQPVPAWVLIPVSFRLEG